MPKYNGLYTAHVEMSYEVDAASEEEANELLSKVTPLDEGVSIWNYSQVDYHYCFTMDDSDQAVEPNV